jgi:hypothetical protein
MKIYRTPTLSRRSFLRGVGVSLALPWLEAMIPRCAAQQAAIQHPLRSLFIYTPNGYNQATFVNSAMESLADLSNDFSLITGLDRTFVGGTGVHAQCGACWMSSSPPQETLDGGFPTNTTLDQQIAKVQGRDTPMASLELSCNDFTDNKETRYYECVSWIAPGYPSSVEKNPRTVFQRMFGQANAGAKASVLDVIAEDAKTLTRKLGAGDREKMDEYLTSVRETERRIQFAEKAAARLKDPGFPMPAGIPESRTEYLDMMADLFLFAFQQDLTRVASLVVDPERWDSPRMFHGVFDKPQNHHVLTHTKTQEAKDAITRIDRFHIDFYARVLRKMKAVKEGEGTMLDHSMVVMGSGISDGDLHRYSNLQVLLAGKAGGALRSVGLKQYEGERPLADLWLTLAQAAGIPSNRFADSTKPLKEIQRA